MLRLLLDTICKQTVQIIASDGSIIEAHRLEYHTSGRLILTFTVCIEDPIENVK